MALYIGYDKDQYGKQYEYLNGIIQEEMDAAAQLFIRLQPEDVFRQQAGAVDASAA